MEILFPIKGKNVGLPPSKQAEMTSPDMDNVRPYHKGRLRGGQRPGLSKLYSQQIGGQAAPVVWCGSVTTID